MTQTADPGHHSPRSRGNPVSVRLLAWGRSAGDVETAVQRAAIGAGRVDWEFADIDRTTAARCPLDLSDPRAIAVDRDHSDAYAWAYAVYAASGAA